jgi:hypothetical protein
MKTRFLNYALVVLVLVLALPQAGPVRAAVATAPQAATIDPLLLAHVEGRQPGDVIVAGVKFTTYLPFVGRPLDCSTGETYYQGIAYKAEPPLLAANHPDKNLSLRGPWVNTNNSYTKLVKHLGSAANDPAAPQLYGLFNPPQVNPIIDENDEVQNWDGTLGHMGPVLAPDPNCPIGTGHCPEVSLTWFHATVGQKICVPNSGYRIGGDRNYEVLVLYADSYEITLKFTREDVVSTGYTIHIAGICVDPTLLALYQSLDQPGGPRYTQNSFNLPNLTAGQALGVSKGTSFGVAIRDTGAFMDPRNYDDWWNH